MDVYSSGEESDEPDDDNDDQEEEHLPENIEDYLKDTFENFICCTRNCLSLFQQDILSRSLVAAQKLPQGQRRKLVHSALLFSFKVDREENLKRRKKNNQAIVGEANAEQYADTEGEQYRQRTTFEYRIMGILVCRPALCRFYGVTKSTVNSVQKDISNFILIPPVSRRGTHLRSPRTRTANAVTYIHWYARNFGYPCPCGRGSRRDKPVIYLPARMKKRQVFHDHYRPAMLAQGILPLKMSAFGDVWNQRYPSVRIRQPKTDICDTCLKLRALRNLADHQDHLLRSDCQRESFRDNIKLTQLPDSTSVQLTFDYAEKVLLPLFSDTPKIDLFGVGNNSNLLQDNYALPEGHWPADKGINSLASMLLHNILQRHLDKKVLYLMADNCAGQNKNRYMIWWLSYMSLVCPNVERIFLKFLVAGHTKNFCDVCFGMCKRSIKGQDVFSPAALQAFYASSAKCNRVARISDVVWYDWKGFLGQFYSGKIPMVSVQHEFEFRRSNPGVVFYKKYADSPQWSETNLFTRIEGVNTAAMKDAIRNGSDKFAPLSDFIIDTSSYALENREVVRKGQPLTTRKAYLQEDVVNEYFVGDKEHHADKFFEVGDPDIPAEADAAPSQTVPQMLGGSGLDCSEHSDKL